MGRDKDRGVTLQNGGSPSAEKGAVATGGGGVASALGCGKPHPPPSPPG